MHHVEETTRATLSNKYNTFNTFINVKHKLMKDYQSEEKFRCFFLEIINSISSLKHEEISLVLFKK